MKAAYIALGALALAGAYALQAQTGSTPAKTPGMMTQGDPTLGKTSPQLAEGRAVYEHWCAPCHAPDPKLAGTAALRVKYEGELPAALVHREDMDKDTIAYFVRNGVAWMAPFRKTEITDAQLDQLTDFLTAPLEQRGVNPADVKTKGAGK